MKRDPLTAERVLEEIEFELAQGAVSRDALGRSVQAIRAFQNRQRGELLAGKPDAADALSRQLQLNDMLLTLVQEMAAEIEAMRLTLRRTEAPRPVEPVAPAPQGVAPAVGGELPWRPTRELHEAMRPEALEVTMDARPAGIPVVGAMAQRLRLALHDLILFYLRRFGQKQGTVNQTYGEWLLHLNELHALQQGQIEALGAQLDALRAERDER